MRIYKLRFLSALHVDSRGSGQPETAEEFIRSDTLSAALSVSWAAIYPAADTAFFEKPPFMISSAFPYIGNLLLFPAPVWRFWKDMNPLQYKKAKSIRWVSQQIFHQVISGLQLDYDAVQVIPCGIALLKDEIKTNPHLENFRAWVMSERQRVSVDRLGLPKDEGLFFFALQFFAPQSGLYFFADTEFSEQKKLRAALEFLGDTGIGADRNNGLGHFEVILEDQFQFSEVMNPEGWVTLSLFNPGKNDNLDDLIQKTAYGLTTRSGWITNSTLGRPPVQVFTESSFFSAKPVGRILPMRIEEKILKFSNLHHPVLRDFRAMCLPCAEPVHLKESANEHTS